MHADVICIIIIEVYRMLIVFFAEKRIMELFCCSVEFLGTDSLSFHHSIETTLDQRKDAEEH